MSNFQEIIPITLEHEGGFVNHPSDPGGMTNLGVTKSTWEKWTGNVVTEAEMQALTVTDVVPLYKKRYWDRIEGDKLPKPMALCVFDFAVNSGPKRAVEFLQKMIRSPQDGIIGPNTLAALQEHVTAHGMERTIRDYCAMRRAFLRNLNTFSVFGRGWMSRVGEIEEKAKEMIDVKR